MGEGVLAEGRVQWRYLLSEMLNLRCLLVDLVM
jgi:hypothetical protein